jgi:hypothetical protein
MKRLGTCVVVLGALLSARASEVSKDAAAPVVSKYLQSMGVGVLVTLGRVGTKCADNDQVKNFDPTRDIQFVAGQKAGFLTITPDGPDFWKVELTEVKPAFAEAMKKVRHKIANGCDYQDFLFGIARRSLVEIINVKPLTATTAEVQYTWKWEPFPSFAKLAEQLSPEQQSDLEKYIAKWVAPQNNLHFRVTDVHGDEIRSGRRTLKLFDDGWRLVLDRETAAPAIDAKFRFDQKAISVTVGRIGLLCVYHMQDLEFHMSDPREDLYTAVALAAGYVTVVPDSIAYWRVSLTDQGKSQAQPTKHHEVEGGCDFEDVTFMVAQRTLAEITNIVSDDNTGEVTYTWKWAPTDLGSALAANGRVYLKLTPAQRMQLRKILADTSIMPALSLPFPLNSVSKPETIKLKKSSGWSWTMQMPN